ncbi:MAG TPA: hypothetical protein VGB30_13475 [bacterium]
MKNPTGLIFGIPALIALMLAFPDAARAASSPSWGGNAAGAPVMLSIPTKGIAFLVVWIVEAIIFKKNSG